MTFASRLGYFLNLKVHLGPIQFDKISKVAIIEQNDGKMTAENRLSLDKFLPYFLPSKSTYNCEPYIVMGVHAKKLDGSGKSLIKNA